MGRGGLDEWERWLETLDAKFRVVHGEIVSELDAPFSIPLHYCDDVAGIVQCAAWLREALLANPAYLPHEYLIKRFIRLAIDANKLLISKAEILSELPKEWNIGN